VPDATNAAFGAANRSCAGDRQRDLDVVDERLPGAAAGRPRRRRDGRAPRCV